MKRLTTRNREGVAMYKQPYVCDQCGKIFYRLPDLGNGSPTDCLAAYEELEEQNKLLKLPCKIGDLVYTVDFIDKQIEKERICSIEISEYGVDIFARDIQDDLNNYLLTDFGESVYLTREEAEKALREFKKMK